MHSRVGKEFSHHTCDYIIPAVRHDSIPHSFKRFEVMLLRKTAVTDQDMPIMMKCKTCAVWVSVYGFPILLDRPDVGHMHRKGSLYNGFQQPCNTKVVQGRGPDYKIKAHYLGKDLVHRVIENTASRCFLPATVTAAAGIYIHFSQVIPHNPAFP